MQYIRKLRLAWRSWFVYLNIAVTLIMLDFNSLCQRPPANGIVTSQIDQNSTLPCTISSIQVANAPHTRKAFLEKILNPLLSANKDGPYTLSEALREVSRSTEKLHKFGTIEAVPILPPPPKPNKK